MQWIWASTAFVLLTLHYPNQTLQALFQMVGFWILLNVADKAQRFWRMDCAGRDQLKEELERQRRWKAWRGDQQKKD